MAQPKRLIPINAEYIGTYINDHSFRRTALSEEMGYDKAFLGKCLKRAEMAPADIKFLSLLTGMDEKQMKVVPKLNPVRACDIPDAIPDVSDAFKTYSAINENTEIVVSYIQDLGKILSDTLRELRETKAMFKEYIDKHGREFHELDVYLRNSGAEARKSREAMNNTLGKTHNYLERKLEQQK